MLKTKSIKNISTQLTSYANRVGLLLLAVLAVASSFELPEHGNKIAPGLQPVYASAGDHFNDPSRRERDEVGPHYISYSISQRTPGRTGRQ